MKLLSFIKYYVLVTNYYCYASYIIVIFPAVCLGVSVCVRLLSEILINDSTSVWICSDLYLNYQCNQQMNGSDCGIDLNRVSVTARSNAWNTFSSRDFFLCILRILDIQISIKIDYILHWAESLLMMLVSSLNGLCTVCSWNKTGTEEYTVGNHKTTKFLFNLNSAKILLVCNFNTICYMNSVFY